MTRNYPSQQSRSPSWIAIALFAAIAIVFARTAYPTITWWDSSSYSLAAATLGVASPPGSLILTLLGWPIAKLVAPTQVAHALNVFAGLIAAGIVALVFINAIKLFENANGERAHTGVMIGAAFGALLFASTTTLWDYAIRFTPYGLSAFFTTILLVVMLVWWKRADDPNAWLLLVVLSFLFGVDFSVHRTNALLIPGALVWVLLRKPTSVVSVRTVALSFAALVVGLSVQLLVIPLAALGGSPDNFSNPNSLSRLWDYVSLRQLGGGFLLGLFPRKSDVLSSQVADVIQILRDNFFSSSGALGVLGFAPGVAAMIGVIALARRNVRLTIAILSVLALQIVFTILYFNIPANYFRSFDRHYLPICATIGILGACGLGALFEWTTRARNRALAITVATILCVVPIAHLISNYHRHDASKRFFAHDWARNALSQLPADAVYLTVGDNDTFPVMYVQAVEGVRRDVAIINTSIALLPEWRARLHAEDPRFPLSRTVTVDSITRSPNFARPIAFAVTGIAAGITGPKDSTRFEGLHWLAAPPANRRADLVLARRNLFQKSTYSGYADRSVVIDPFTPEMAFQYYSAASELLAAEIEQGAAPQCRTDRDEFLKLIPPDRVSLPEDVRAKFVSMCGP